jgi:hypothetical protein
MHFRMFDIITVDDKYIFIAWHHDFCLSSCYLIYGIYINLSTLLSDILNKNVCSSAMRGQISRTSTQYNMTKDSLMCLAH